MREPLDGVVVIDKPLGPTSFDVVRRARQVTGARKVGHGGTLDPLASGVLPLCFGEGTKLAQFLLDADKEYQATFQLGAETETDDAAGAVTRLAAAEHVTEPEVKAALLSFLGEQAQIPPMYSALKREGRPLYDYARAGETVERAPRNIRILAFDLLQFRRAGSVEAPAPGPALDVRVRCTKGTYIRTLARDLGRALGTVAHVTALRRTRSGPFDLAQAIALEDLGRGPLRLVSPADALSDLPAVHLDDAAALRVTQGKPVSWGELSLEGTRADEVPASTGGLTRFLSASGELVAVARRGLSGDRVHTLRVFLPASLPGFRAEARFPSPGAARDDREVALPKVQA